jgi:hypothetical protein
MERIALITAAALLALASFGWMWYEWVQFFLGGL